MSILDKVDRALVSNKLVVDHNVRQFIDLITEASDPKHIRLLKDFVTTDLDDLDISQHLERLLSVGTDGNSAFNRIASKILSSNNLKLSNLLNDAASKFIKVYSDDELQEMLVDVDDIKPRLESNLVEYFNSLVDHLASDGSLLEKTSTKSSIVSFIQGLSDYGPESLKEEVEDILSQIRAGYEEQTDDSDDETVDLDEPESEPEQDEKIASIAKEVDPPESPGFLSPEYLEKQSKSLPKIKGAKQLIHPKLRGKAERQDRPEEKPDGSEQDGEVLMAKGLEPSVGSKRIDILRSSPEEILVRVAGYKVDPKTGEKFRTSRFALLSNEMLSVNDVSKVSKDDIWEYLKALNNKRATGEISSIEYNKFFSNNIKSTYEKLDKTVGNFKDFLRQYVGSNSKEMLFKAYIREYPHDNLKISGILSTLDNKEVLKISQALVPRMKINYDKIALALDHFQKQYLNQNISESRNILSETALSDFLEKVKDNWSKLGAEITSSDVALAKQFLIYKTIAKHIGADPSWFYRTVAKSAPGKLDNYMAVKGSGDIKSHLSRNKEMAKMLQNMDSIEDDIDSENDLVKKALEAARASISDEDEDEDEDEEDEVSKRRRDFIKATSDYIKSGYKGKEPEHKVKDPETGRLFYRKQDPKTSATVERPVPEPTADMAEREQQNLLSAVRSSRLTDPRVAKAFKQSIDNLLDGGNLSVTEYHAANDLAAYAVRGELDKFFGQHANDSQLMDRLTRFLGKI